MAINITKVSDPSKFANWSILRFQDAISGSQLPECYTRQTGLVFSALYDVLACKDIQHHDPIDRFMHHVNMIYPNTAHMDGLEILGFIVMTTGEVFALFKNRDVKFLVARAAVARVKPHIFFDQLRDVDDDSFTVYGYDKSGQLDLNLNNALENAIASDDVNTIAALVQRYNEYRNTFYPIAYWVHLMHK